MNFRADINGLRAYAVIAVIIFHFNRSWLPGGFAGVDIFFVISGYLMTAIIFRGLEGNNFSIWKFYSARIKRIVPALLVLVIILMIFGYLFLAPIPYTALAKHSGSSLLFVSNIMYWKESGYFDTAVIEKFLLHTWSLSVEWQFYIIYPILLSFLYKIIGIKTLKKTIVVLTAACFFGALYASYHWAIWSYFLLPTRIWEMMLGGIAFLYPIKLTKKLNKFALEIFGLILILLSFFVVSENTQWPGYMALLPTLVTFILIQANNDKSLFTNNLVCQKLGLWSYSLYLYHWPLLAINHRVNLGMNVGAFLTITLILSIVSYYVIEIKKWKIRSILILLVFILSVIIAVYKTHGASYRIDKRFGLTTQKFRNLYEGHINKPNDEEPIFFNSNSNDFEYILFGNSHARHLFSFIEKNNIKAVSFTLDGCTSTKNYYSTYDENRCKNIYSNLIEFLDKNTNKKIIVSISWGAMMKDRKSSKKAPVHTSTIMVDEINNLLHDVEQRGHTVFLIGETQGSNEISFLCLAENELSINKVLKKKNCLKYNLKKEKANNKILEQLSNNKNMFYINTDDALCDKDRCKVIHDGSPIYTDTSHLSVYGADIVGKYIFKKIDEIEQSQQQNVINNHQ